MIMSLVCLLSLIKFMKFNEKEIVHKMKPTIEYSDIINQTNIKI